MGHRDLRYRTHRFVRSDLGEDIRKYWGGKRFSNVGLQYLELKDGQVHVTNYIERTDVLMVQGEGINVFVDANGRQHIEPHDPGETSPNSMKRAAQAAQDAYEDEIEFCEHEGEWLKEKPWKLVEGMTPTQAADFLFHWEIKHFGSPPGENYPPARR